VDEYKQRWERKLSERVEKRDEVLCFFFLSAYQQLKKKKER